MELKEIKEKKETLEKQIKDNDAVIQELLENEKVKKYISISEDNEKLKDSLKKLLLELACREIMECNHIFVKTEVVSDRSDRDRVTRTNVYHCLKCGLTNEYQVKEVPISKLDDLQKEMFELYYGNACNGIFIRDEIYSLDKASAIYDLIMRINPSISLDEFKNAFPTMYKTRYGKKSAAEQWYKMEQRCEDNAIATLNRILKNNEGKRK